MKNTGWWLIAIGVVGAASFGSAAVFLKRNDNTHLSTPMGQDDDTIRGRVTQVTTGELLTLTVAQKTPLKISVFGISVPPPSEPIGKIARDKVLAWTENKDVLCRLRGVDNDRILGEIILPNTRELGHMLLLEGLATYKKSDDPDNAQLQALEDKARQNKRGMWQDQ